MRSLFPDQAITDQGSNRLREMSEPDPHGFGDPLLRQPSRGFGGLLGGSRLEEMHENAFFRREAHRSPRGPYLEAGPSTLGNPKGFFRGILTLAGNCHREEAIEWSENIISTGE